MTLLLLMLLTSADRPYHRVAVKDIPRTVWTHVCTTGIVGTVRSQPDGDVHVRLDDAGAFVMLEIIPQLFLPRPKVGQRIVACGITREDRAHSLVRATPARNMGWCEVNLMRTI